MSEKPILFSGPMVRAILRGYKTQTRRVVKPQFGNLWGQGVKRTTSKYSIHVDSKAEDGSWNWIESPYQVGDRLWVRETFADLRGMGFDEQVAYQANSLNKHGDEDYDSERCRKDYGVKWKPSIFMPRWASRITLEVTGVRVERLASIDNVDLMREAVGPANYTNDADPWDDFHGKWEVPFIKLWDKLNKAYPFESDPWVWVIEFKRVEAGR